MEPAPNYVWEDIHNNNNTTTITTTTIDIQPTTTNLITTNISSDLILELGIDLITEGSIYSNDRFGSRDWYGWSSKSSKCSSLI